jgi:hypothetical protein
MSTRASFFVLIAVVLFALPARAQSVVTYNFVESNNSTVGAILVFYSPPAFPKGGWSASASGAVASFQLTDGAIGPIGGYSTYAVNIISNNGTSLSSGAIAATRGSPQLISAFNQSAMGFALTGLYGTAYGTWVLVPSPVDPHSQSVAEFRAGLPWAIAHPGLSQIPTCGTNCSSRH